MIEGLHINKGFSLEKPSKYYSIKPVPKPRMTQRDKWNSSPAAKRYFAYKDEVRLLKIDVPIQGYRITFIIPMPKTWSKKKKAKMLHKPHQQRPDKDNLEKALLDAAYGEDCIVYDGWTRKIWGETGGILIEDICCLFTLAMTKSQSVTIEPEI